MHIFFLFLLREFQHGVQQEIGVVAAAFVHFDDGFVLMDGIVRVAVTEHHLLVIESNYADAVEQAAGVLIGKGHARLKVLRSERSAVTEPVADARI